MSTLSFSLRHLVLGTSIAMAIGTAGCCMGGGSSTPSAPILPPIAPIAPVAPAMAPAAMQAVTLAAGFMPDPNVVTTTAGGPISASTLAPPDGYCAGSIGVTPNVTLTTTTPITGLRVLVRSTEDTTLMVRLSDGRVLCDDDGGGYPNPMVQADFPAGVHQIYVGSFHTDETPAATLGFTELATLTNDQLP